MLLVSFGMGVGLVGSNRQRLIAARLLEEAHDLFLLRLCLWRASAAAAGILNCELHRRRSMLVLASRIGATVEERADCGSATVAHGAMQRRYSALVDGVWVGARFNETRDGRRLRRRIPPARAGRALDSVMKRFGAAAIPRADVGARGNQSARDCFSVGRGSHMKCRVARIGVVLDLVEVVCLRRLTGRTVFESRSHQGRRGGKEAQCGRLVADDNRTYQRHQVRLSGSHRHWKIAPQWLVKHKSGKSRSTFGVAWKLPRRIPWCARGGRQKR